MNTENAKDRKQPGEVYRDGSKVEKLKTYFSFQKQPGLILTETKEVVPSLDFVSLLCVFANTDSI